MGIRNYLDAIDWETVQKVGKQPWSGWARSKPLVVGNGLFSTAPELTGVLFAVSLFQYHLESSVKYL